MSKLTNKCNKESLKDLQRQRSQLLLTRNDFLNKLKLFKYAKQNLNNWTKAERLMNGWLSNWGLKHNNQVVIDKYIVDLLLPEYKTIIELDGIQHKQNLSYDTKRTFDLINLGYKLIRFDNIELRDRKAVKDKLLTFLNDSIR